jgi:indolepyruvate ferredoxin oxidoreductase alpha subunit
LALEASLGSTLNRIQISGNIGIIASGYPATLVEGFGVSVFSLGYVHPLPWNQLRRFIDGHRAVLVAEEPLPFIESQLRMSPKVKGKFTGHLPFGPLVRSDIIKALGDLEKSPERILQSYENAEERGFSGICDNCHFIPLFKVLKRLDVDVAGDAGCTIRATREPYRSIDVVYGLGSSIGVASGFKNKGIAVIGDFAFAHSGICGLMNAVWQKRDVLVIMLQNGIAATTGGQEAPNFGKLLETIVPTCTIQLPASEEEIEYLIRDELARSGPSGVILDGRCAKLDLR